MAIITEDGEGRKVRITCEGGVLTLTVKEGRRKPPTVVTHNLTDLLGGDAGSVLDDLARRVPIADLEGIRPDRVGYELKVRLMALLKPKPHDDEEHTDSGETTDADSRSVDRGFRGRAGRRPGGRKRL